MSNNYTSKAILEEIARKRVGKIKRFYFHFFIFIIGAAIYIGKTYLGLPFNFSPFNMINQTFMLIWTFVISIVGLRLFFKERVLGDSWEHKKIQKIMDKDKAQNNKWE